MIENKSQHQEEQKNNISSRNSESIATKEWAHLQAVIARLEETEYRIRNWLFPILTALALASFSKTNDKLILEPNDFLFMTFALITTFMGIELFHRPPKRKAIERSKTLEDCLKKMAKGQSDSYNGPRLAEYLSKARLRDLGWSNVIKEFIRMLFHGPYFWLYFFVGTIYFFHANTDFLHSFTYFSPLWIFGLFFIIIFMVIVSFPFFVGWGSKGIKQVIKKIKNILSRINLSQIGKNKIKNKNKQQINQK